MSTPSLSMRSKDIRPAPAEIAYKNMKFLITDRPTDSTIQNYIMELKRHNCLDVVRVCEPTYKVSELESEGIRVTDLAFEDGTSPPQEVNYLFIIKRLMQIKVCCRANKIVSS